MAKFYGFDNLYGVGTCDNDGERIGAVLVFSSLASRDAWIRSEVLCYNRYHHESITAAEARRVMVRVAFDEMLNKGIVSSRADLRYVPMDVIVESYARVMM